LRWLYSCESHHKHNTGLLR